VHRTEDTQRADKEELAGRHAQRRQRVGQQACLPVVHAVKVGRVGTFRHTGTMHHVVKTSVGREEFLQLAAQHVGTREVQLQKLQPGL